MEVATPFSASSLLHQGPCTLFLGFSGLSTAGFEKFTHPCPTIQEVSHHQANLTGWNQNLRWKGNQHLESRQSYEYSVINNWDSCLLSCDLSSLILAGISVWLVSGSCRACTHTQTPTFSHTYTHIHTDTLLWLTRKMK